MPVVKIIHKCFQISSDTFSITKKMELTTLINILHIHRVNKPHDFEYEVELESISAWKLCFDFLMLNKSHI